MAWILRIEAKATVTEAISAALWDLGTTGVAESTSPAPAVGDTVTLLAGFHSETQATVAASAIAPLAASTAVGAVDAQAWFDEDRRGHLHLPTGTIELAVGPAFGSGEHPTTRLALDLLLPMVDAGTSVLDFGTGTGILAVAAAATGAGRILAVDNDPAARAVAESNLAANVGPAAPMTVAGRLPAATAAPETGFDVTVANVLLDAHRRHGKELADLTASTGSVIVAGALTSQRAELLASYPGLAVVEERRSVAPAGGGGNDRWLALRLVAANTGGVGRRPGRRS